MAKTLSAAESVPLHCCSTFAHSPSMPDLQGNIAAASKLFQEASKLMCNGQPCAAGLVAWADTLAERGEHGAALARSAHL